MPVIPRSQADSAIPQSNRRSGCPGRTGGPRRPPGSGPIRLARMKNITVLSGGMGGARFLQGLRHGIAAGTLPGVDPDAEVTVIANTADDLWMHGLKICPDLDTVMYTLGDGIDLERGLGSARRDVERQGRAGGVRRGADLVRPRRPRPRHPPRAHPDARRRLPALRGHRGAVPALAARRAAAADDRRPGRDPRRDRRPRVARAASGSCTSRSTGCGCAPRCRPRPVDRRRPRVLHPRARACIDAITDADLVVLPPSNPVVSVGTILGVPRRARGAARDRARRSSACRPSSAAPTCAAWPTRC